MNFGINSHFFKKHRLPLFLQSEASECGIACLSMIATFYGMEISVREMRSKFPISLKGISLDQLMEMADELNLSTRPLRLEIEELGLLKTPCILHWNLSHFVILKSVKKNNIVVFDPASGEVNFTFSSASPHFSGVALELAPKLEFKRISAPPPLGLSKLVGKVIGLKRGIIQLTILAIALEAVSLLMPLLTQWVTDDAIVSNDVNLLKLLSLCILLLGITSTILSALRTWVGIYISTSFKVQWMSNLMAHLLKLPVEFFERRHLGDIVNRFGSVAAIEHMLTTAIVDVMLDGILATGTLILMFLYNLTLGFIALFSVLIYCLIRWARYGANKYANQGLVVKQSLEQTYFLETVRGVRSVKLFNRENQRRTGWLSRIAAVTNAEVTLQKMSLGFSGIWGGVFSCERAIVLWVGATAVINEQMTLGMLIAFLSYKEQFASRATNLIDRFVDFKMLSVQVERLSDIVLADPEKTSSSQHYEIPTKLSLSIENLSFRYGAGESNIVTNVNLKIYEGECVAIVGASGGGKSTVMKLMLGILTPHSGTIKIGDIPLSKLGLRKYRSIIGTVMQDDQLYSGSIFDNISFFDENPDRELIENCAKAAAIHADVMSMPMTYHTLVGDMGTVLSGGQKQRVLLARALYKKPRILFLDEATSHLDHRNESEINAALNKLNIIRIMIAHRPDTIAIANRIFQIDKGRMFEVRLAARNDKSVEKGLVV